MIIPLFTTFANGVKAKVNGEGVHRCWVSGRVLPRVGNLDMINDDHNTTGCEDFVDDRK